MINNGLNTFKVSIGDKIVQIIFEKYNVFNLDLVNKLDETIRGCGAFGSTGK